MRTISARLRRLETSVRLTEYPRYVLGLMDYDDSGYPARLEIAGRTLAPLVGELEDVFVERAKQETGTEHLVLVQFVKPGPHGGLAPGFERFAK
jgi:hypothetical protein